MWAVEKANLDGTEWVVIDAATDDAVAEHIADEGTARLIADAPATAKALERSKGLLRLARNRNSERERYWREQLAEWNRTNQEYLDLIDKLERGISG